MSNLPQGVTPEMLTSMIANPGEVVSAGPSLQASEVRTPSTSVDINQRASKGVRPYVSGNSHDPTGARIDRPSKNLAARLEAGHKENMAESARLQEEEKIRREQDPSNLYARINYLERQMKKLNTNLNKLIKAQSNE